MFVELHYHTDREIRKLDLAEKMAERRNQSLSDTRRSPLRARLARMFFAPAAAAEKQEAWRTATEGSGATGRT